jgi:DNA (cytosine-5)-methyltransferase 1
VKVKKVLEKPENPPQRKFTCVDLFAGAGGFSLAAINAGLRVLAAVEYDKSAAETYRYNIPKAQTPAPRLYECDMLKLSPQEFKQQNFSTGEECDILLGGPPCQGFSVHRIKGAGIDDDRNKLILRYFAFVSELQPKLFLMENVPGITWPRHRSYLEAFYREGKKAGYHILPPITLDARDYGVPQRRKRVFILGMRSDFASTPIEWPPVKSHGDEAARAENAGLAPWLNAHSVFAKRSSASDENNVHMNHNSELVKVFESTPANGGSRRNSNRVLPCHEKHNGHTDVYGRIDPDKPAPTMTTACTNPSKGRFLHPTEHHGITARQAARFQTFPDWYMFKGGLMASAKQIGNAVPVDFGVVLIRSMIEALNGFHPKVQQ